MNPSVLNAIITNTTTGEVRQGFDLNTSLPAGFSLTSVRAKARSGRCLSPARLLFRQHRRHLRDRKSAAQLHQWNAFL